MIFRIYAKFSNEKRFKALDVNEARQVNNLIRATIITEAQLPRVMEGFKMVPSNICKIEARVINKKKKISINF